MDPTPQPPSDQPGFTMTLKAYKDRSFGFEATIVTARLTFTGTGVDLFHRSHPDLSLDRLRSEGFGDVLLNAGGYPAPKHVAIVDGFFDRLRADGFEIGPEMPKKTHRFLRKVYGTPAARFD